MEIKLMVKDVNTSNALERKINEIIENTKESTDLPKILSVITNIMVGLKLNMAMHIKSKVYYNIAGFQIRTSEPKCIDVCYFTDDLKGDVFDFEVIGKQRVPNRNLFTKEIKEFKETFHCKDNKLEVILSAVIDIYDKHFIQKKYFFRTDEYGKNKPLKE